MSERSHILTSHGFLERPHARRLYTDLRDIYGSQYDFHLLDMYKDLSNGDRQVPQLEEQTQTMQSAMDRLDGEITVLAKSGGCRVPSMMDDEHLARVGKMVLFVSPERGGRKPLLWQIRHCSGVEQPDGTWHVPRSHGGQYVVSKEYIDNVSELSLVDRYRKIAKSATNLIIVRAMADEVFDPIDMTLLPEAGHVDIPEADHHFVLPGIRARLLQSLAERRVL